MTPVDLEAIRTRLDEAEAAARAAIRPTVGSIVDSGRWVTPTGRDSGAVYDETGGVVVYADGMPTDAQARHIASWDPARVLALIARDRATLDRHAGEQCPCTHEHRECVQDGQDWPCPDVVAVWSFWMETPAC